ncbi:hypothetical protein ACFYY2_07575 [Streptomyces sp. NPDC001822]|uniref:hypothetical protein n=1 Tax=Streptomyces sp. NPDC001822 TaxID=3364614 RepID=UPI003677270B
MSTTLDAAIQRAAGTIHAHRDAVCLALITETVDRQRTSLKRKAKGLYREAAEARAFAERLHDLDTRLTFHLGNVADIVRAAWDDILTAVVCREATELVNGQKARRKFAESGDGPARRVATLQFEAAEETARELSQVKEALTAIRDASRSADLVAA